MKNTFIILIILSYGITIHAQTQLDIQGNSSTSDVANIMVNYSGQSNVVGLRVKSEPSAGSGIGALFFGGDKGIMGITTSGYGVYGKAEGSSGLNYGGYFECDGTIGRAVFGLAAGTTNMNYGGWFKAKGIEGTGVYGEASDVNGINYGGYFLAKSIRGRAVFGLAEYVQGGENYGGWFKGKGDIGGTGVYAWGNKYDFYADGPGMDYGSSSSKRWKSNIRKIDNPIEKMNRLRGVYYNWDEEHGGTHDVGFIAEEIGEVLPEIVAYEKNGIDAKGMDYSKVTPLLVEAVNAMRREYQEKFEEQQFEIDQLREEITLLKKMVLANSLAFNSKD